MILPLKEKGMENTLIKS